MAEQLLLYASVFLMALLGIWKAIPLGFALGLSPVFIYISTIAGAWVAAFVIYFFGDFIRKLFRKRKPLKPEKKAGKAELLFQKYGTLGLGLFGTLIIGPNATLLLGLLIVKSAKQLLTFTLLAIAWWSLVLTSAAAAGIELFKFLGQ